MRKKEPVALAVQTGGKALRFSLLALCLLGVLTLLPAAAHAAFPGANGSIAYTHIVRCPGDPGSYPPDLFEIFKINPDGSGETDLSNTDCAANGDNPEQDDYPAYSPDGKKIAFLRSTPVEGATGIYVMNADGSGKRRLADAGQPAPSWSPDGAKILFVGGNNDLFTVNVAGGAPTPVGSATPQNEFNPVYSPDGTKIAFQADLAGAFGQQDIFTINADGTGRTNLTNNPGGEGAPDFSPDGAKLVFHRQDPITFQTDVFSIGVNGAGETRLTDSDGEDADAVFSPDGNKIAFKSQRRQNTVQTAGPEIYTMNADGSNQARLTSAADILGQGDAAPSWQPIPRAAIRPGARTVPPVLQPSAAFTGCPVLTANVVRGNAASNSITGTTAADRIFAGTGNDVVDALAGNDCVDLGAGTDRGQGGLGDDFLLGGLGNDTVSGASGNDRLLGDDEDDRLSGGTGNDRILGGSGLDVIFGGFGNDKLHGESANDRISGSRGRDQINGGNGNDRISGDSSNDSIRGDAGNDRVSGGSGSDRLRGNPGRDRLSGGSGHDRIGGDQGNDRISGGSERDRLSGGSGDDRISSAGDGARDRVSCGRGFDRVVADRLDVVSRSCETVVRRR